MLILYWLKSTKPLKHFDAVPRLRWVEFDIVEGYNAHVVASVYQISLPVAAEI